MTAPAEAFANSRLELIEDSYVLIPFDQPGRLAELIRAHVARQHSTAEATT